MLLLGGAIVIMAPYHYTGYVALPGEVDAFEIWGSSGYYPQLEIAITVSPDTGNTTVFVDIRVQNNETLELDIVNMTLSSLDAIPDTNPIKFEKREVLDLDVGNYTIYVDNIQGAADVDISFTQISDSRLYIVTGGVMNIIGLIMGATGYCIGGTLIPSGEETIVEWGFDDRQHPK